MSAELFTDLGQNILALLLGVATTVIGNLGIEAIRSLEARKQTEAAKFKQAIESDSLEALGTYLSTTLGALHMDAYLNDAKTRGRVDKYLTKVAGFLAAPEPTKEEQGTSTLPFDKSTSAHPDQSSILRLAIQRIESGNTWDALALLRRDLEVELRRRSVPSSSYTAPRDLSAFAKLSARAQQAFTQFWRKASAAIHGDDISATDAMTAVDLAGVVYDEVRALPEFAPNEHSYRVGDEIFHAKFGYGVIRTIEGSKLTVDFRNVGEKRVIDSFVVPASAA